MIRTTPQIINFLAEMIENGDIELTKEVRPIDDENEVEETETEEEQESEATLNPNDMAAIKFSCNFEVYPYMLSHFVHFKIKFKTVDMF